MNELQQRMVVEVLDGLRKHAEARGADQEDWMLGFFDACALLSEDPLAAAFATLINEIFAGAGVWKDKDKARADLGKLFSAGQRVAYDIRLGDYDASRKAGKDRGH